LSLVLLLISLEVAFAGVVSAVAVNLYGVLSALAVDAAKLLALFDGACARRVLASIRRFHFIAYIFGHLSCSSVWLLCLKKDKSVLCQIARRVKKCKQTIDSGRQNKAPCEA
jgi:hypothetical protein